MRRHRALSGGGHGGHGGHHHGGGGFGPGFGWGPGWGGYEYPATELVVLDTAAAPSGPLYSSCPCPCRCHDDPRIRTHTVPVRGGQACCRCPFKPRAQAMKGVGGFDLANTSTLVELGVIAALVAGALYFTRPRGRR